MMNVKEVAAKYKDYIVEMRREFHKIPEASMHEYKTSMRIAAELDEMGVEYRRCGGETGWLVTIGGKKPGKCVLLRADIDGLSVTEQTGLDFASEHEGFMHACGHDFHIACLLTACQILKDMEDELCGTVKLAFQPGEEVAQGAKAMIADGALEGVDAVMSMHVWGGVEAGVFAIEPGEKMASCGQFKIKITGKGSHGSMPSMGIDAATVAAATLMNLQTIVSRENLPTDPSVVTAGVMKAGERWNVLAAEASLEGTTRAFNPEVSEKFGEQIKRIAEMTAASYRAKAEVEYANITTPVVNDPEVTAICKAAAEKIVGKDRFMGIGKIMGAEDFCYFMSPCSNVPGVQTFIGSGCEFANHHPGFNPQESALLDGASVYAQFAVDFLNQ